MRAHHRKPNGKTAATIGTVVVFWLVALSGSAAPLMAQTPPGTAIVNVASAEHGVPPISSQSNPVVTSVVGPVAMVVTKSVDPSGTAPPGTTLRFSLMVENPSTSDITGATITDPLDALLIAPSGITTGSVPDMGGGGGSIAVTGSYDATLHRLSWDVPLIPAGARFELEFTTAVDAAAPEDSTVRNTSLQISDQDPAGASSNEVILGVLSASLAISKEASRSRVEVGEVVGYTVVVENISASLDLSAIEIRDRLPKGFRYMEGSAAIDGRKADSVVVSGRDLRVMIGTIGQGSRARLSYVAVPTADAENLDAINVAWASGVSPSGSPVSAGPARATVRVAGSLLSGEAVIVGRVFVDDDRDGVFDEGEVGVPRARVFLEDGTFAVTDVVGKYHLEGVRPGLHVMKTDAATLPEGLGSFASWSRSAGSGATQFVDPGPDQMFKTNVATGGWGLSIARLRAEVLYRDETEGGRAVVFPPLLASAVFEEGSADVGRQARPVVESYAALIRERGGTILSLEVTPSYYPLADEGLMLARAERLRAETRRLILAELPRVPAPIAASPPRSPSYATGASEGPAVIDFSGEMSADMEALEERVRLMDAEPAVLSPTEGAAISAERIDVDVKLPSHLTPRLSVNGVEIGEDRIAVRMETSMTKLVFIRYLGIPVGEGRNSLVLRGLDQRGNERVWVERIVNGVGAPHHVSIQVDDATRTADGRTPARIVVDVRDGQGLPVRDGTLVTLEVDEGEFMGVDAAVDRDGFQTETHEGRAVANLTPIDSTESFSVSARAGEAAGEGEFSLAPELRDWIVAGVGEASVGNRGSASGADLSDLLEEGEEADGRLALFARGRLFGSSLMTLSYDSDKERERDRIFRQIAPDRFFPIYGDSSNQGYAVEGQSRFSMRLDQPRSSMLVGDFTTGLSGGDLLRYDRALTGGAGRLALGGFSMQSFGASTPQTQIRDELEGTGTSGPYRLSHGFVVINSEKVILETRDRFHPERVIDRREMTRFADYDIDTEGGSVLFKRPVAFQDESFNPILVVVTYETLEGDGEDTVAGGRIGYGFQGLGEIGATYVTEGRAGGDYVLRGTDFNLDRAIGGASLRITGEAAQTESGSDQRSGAVGLRVGTAFRNKASLSGYYRNVSSGFQNPSRGGLADVGTIRWGVESGAALGDGSRLKGEVFSQEDSISERDRRVGSLDWEKAVGRLTTRSGFKDVRGTDPATSESAASRLVSAGASLRLSEKLDGSLERQQVVWGSALTDYPTRTALGLGWKVTDGIRSFLKEEFDQSDLGDSSRTVIGLESTLSRRTVMESRYSLEDALHGSRGMAHLGLRTRLPLNQDWLGDASLERVVTTTGISTGDFTALGIGAEYLPARVKFSTRYELRLGETEDTHAVTGAGATRITDAVSLFTRQRLFLVDPDHERARVDGDGLIGLAFRPVEDDSLNFLLKLQAFKGDALRSAGSPRARSYLALFETNYEPVAKLHLLGRLATKESLDTFEGRTFSSRTWLVETRALLDIGTRFNAGVSARVLDQLATGITVTGLGFEGGFRIARDTWLVGGYNITGFEESGFGDNDRRSIGPFFSVRFKFDEETIVGLTRRGENDDLGRVSGD